PLSADILFLCVFFVVLFRLERLVPRFWCRYLCPSGALLAVAGLRPVWRRKVRACIGCGRCVRMCPTQAIAPDGIHCTHSECIACTGCTPVCPAKGITFTTQPVKEPHSAHGNEAGASGLFLPSRLAFLLALGVGAGLGAILV
ncbi:4Fe-4S binding protein, partial [Desulfovibrio sp. OttesenSCG-928-I05]|nr:4Fe-4S binding protein [Desulfovibrio sp. OttesenSCG-928-I05]